MYSAVDIGERCDGYGPRRAPWSALEPLRPCVPSIADSGACRSGRRWACRGRCRRDWTTRVGPDTAAFVERLPRTGEDRPGATPLPGSQGPRQTPPRRHHRRPQLQGSPRAGPIPRAPPRLRAVDPGRPDRSRRRRDGVGKILPGLRARPPGLPPRHLDPLLPRLPAPRRAHPRPGDGSYPKLIQRLARTWLLVLDDWGLASLSGQGRHDLLEVLDDRYARRGTLLASQVPVEHWHDVVGDPTFGDAILDRLLRNPLNR